MLMPSTPSTTAAPAAAAAAGDAAAATTTVPMPLLLLLRMPAQNIRAAVLLLHLPIIPEPGTRYSSAGTAPPPYLVSHIFLSDRPNSRLFRHSSIFQIVRNCITLRRYTLIMNLYITKKRQLWWVTAIAALNHSFYPSTSSTPSMRVDSFS